ncbi:MAG TPA: flagellar hook-basal body complex protein FliE [Patescibacteria group bacterium]|nr:flagellar hook-basal body complex protein FliE [Patescibacteria group bacterium]
MATTSISNAIAAYANVAKAASGKEGGTDEIKTDGGDFAAMIQDGVKAAVDSGKKSEEMSKAGISGKADVRDVVAAVNNAELTLQTVVAVRDKVVSAYNEILRMPI